MSEIFFYYVGRRTSHILFVTKTRFGEVTVWESQTLPHLDSPTFRFGRVRLSHIFGIIENLV